MLETLHKTLAVYTIRPGLWHGVLFHFRLEPRNRKLAILPWNRLYYGIKFYHEPSKSDFVHAVWKKRFEKFAHAKFKNLYSSESTVKFEVIWFTGCTQCATFFERFFGRFFERFSSDLCFAPCPLCNTQENWQLQNDKNERKWVELPVFPVSPILKGNPIDSKSLFDDSR